MAKKRSFQKLREHLTSNDTDNKIEYLESRMPTNNTAFVFQGDPSNPQGNSFETIVDGEENETDYSVGESPTSYTEARDTSGLFNVGGDHALGEYVKTEEPPGDTSYILGPMAAMYYTWSYPWTMIGYIRESDRRMVNLARIDGKLSDWDQSSGFSSYGQITLEQAKWFYNIAKANGNTNDPATYSYRAYYPGPPSAVADAYGRYPCILTGVSKKQPREVPNSTPLDAQSGDNYSAMQAQQQGSGYMSFKPDLEWFKKNKKKPKGAPSDWNDMSDDEKANWISQNQPEERFNYSDGRFTPNQNNAQSNRPDDVPFSFGMNNPLNINDPNNFNQTTTTTSSNQPSTPRTPPSPDDVKAAVGHGLSKGRAESMSSSEIKKFVAQQNALQKDIDKYSKQQKDYEREARNIAIGFGVDVATVLFGGALLKGVAKGVGLAAKGISALNKANKIKKVASAIQKTEKISKAAAVAKATSAVNKADKVNKAAKATEKAIKAAKTSQKASLAKTTKLPKQPLTYKGPSNVKSGTGVGSRRTFNVPKPTTGSASTKVTTGSGTKPFKPGPLTGKSPTGKPLTVGKQTPSTKPGFKPGPLTGKSPTGKPLTVGKQTPVPPKTTGTAKVTTGSGKTSLKTKMQNYINKGKNQQVPNEDTASLRKLVQNDIDQMGKFVKPASRNKPFNQLTKADFEGGPLPMNLDQLRQFVQGKGGLTWSFSRGTVTGPTPLFRQTPRLIKQGLENSVNVISKSPVGQALTKELGKSTVVKVAPHIAKASVQGAKPITKVVASKAIQELIGLEGASEETQDETASKILNVATSVLPKNIKAPGKMFIGYLTGSIKGNAGDSIDADDQVSAWKNLNISPSSNSLNVGGHMVNVFGGETLDNLTVDDEGNAVLKFGFEPTKNEDEFATHPGKYTKTQQKILNLLGPYSADLNIQVPLPVVGTKNPISGATGPIASLMTVLAKGIDKITPDDSFLGNVKTARPLSGDIKIPMSELKSLNPTAYKYLNKQGSTNNKTASSTNSPTDQPAPSNPNKEQTKKSGGITLKWVPGESKRGIPGAWTDITDYPKDTGYQNYAEYMKGKGVKKESVSYLNKREVFGHLTEPIILPETKQKSYKVSPGQRYRNKNKKPEKTNFQGMDKLFNKYDNIPQPFKPQERTSWTKDFIKQNIMQSQEKMNNVLELVGDGKFALHHAMNDYKRMGAKELEQYWGRNPYLYNFYYNNKNYKVTRKEQVEGDFIVFLEDQSGQKINILQSELNEKIQEEKERWLEEMYYRDNPVVTEKGESMYDTIKRRFMEKKDIAPEFPEKAPPKMINGFHPEYGKKANRYKKLDPASANAMPLTGDPETDEIVRKQKTINKIKSMRKKA